VFEDWPVLNAKRPIHLPANFQIIAFQGVMIDNIEDCMRGSGAISRLAKPLNGKLAIVCGPVLTCFACPNDNLGVMGLFIWQRGVI
jgi:hypothetical protein